jgi:uncharacterized membrane protein
MIVLPGRANSILREAWLPMVIGGALLLLLQVPGPALFVWPMRLLLGTACVLFVPGYCLSVALWPDSRGLGPAERVGLSVGMSVALIPVLALLLDKTGWGLSIWPIATVELTVSVAALAVAVWRRRRVRTFGLVQPGPVAAVGGWWQDISPDERRAVGVLLAGLVISVFALGAAVRIPAELVPMTELYILGQDGRGEVFPRSIAPGEQVSLSLGIANREIQAHRYRIEGWATPKEGADRRDRVLLVGPIELQANQNQILPVTWQMLTVGPDQRIDILLYLDDSEQPYRQLRLWLDVVAPTEAAVATIPTNLLPSDRGPMQPEAQPGTRPVRPDVPIVVEFAPSVTVGEGVAPTVAPAPPAGAATTDQPAATVAGVPTADAVAPAIPPGAAADAPVAPPAPAVAQPPAMEAGDPPPAAVAAPESAAAVVPAPAAPTADVAAPAPSPTQAVASPAPALQTFIPFWVKNHRWAVLWSGPAGDRDAIALGVTSSQFCSFLVVLPQDSERVFVFNPFSANYAWIDALDLGPVEMPAVRAGQRLETQNCDGSILQ